LVAHYIGPADRGADEIIAIMAPELREEYKRGWNDCDKSIKLVVEAERAHRWPDKE